MKTIQSKTEDNDKIKRTIMDMLANINDARKLECICAFIQGIHIRQ